jgi:hypothetical protein
MRRYLSLLPGLGLTVLTVFLYPTLLDQGYIRPNLYILPILCVACLTCFFVPFLAHHRFLTALLWFENRFGVANPRMTLILITVFGAVLGGAFAYGGTVLFRKHKLHIAEVIKREGGAGNSGSVESKEPSSSERQKTPETFQPREAEEKSAPGIHYEVKTEEPKSEPKDAGPSGPVAVYNAKGGEFFASCSVIYGPDGKAIENHGKVTLDHTSVNAPQSCSPSQIKASYIDGLILETTDSSFIRNARSENAWTIFSKAVLSDNFNEQVVKDFEAQPDFEKRIEFLKKLRASLQP